MKDYKEKLTAYYNKFSEEKRLTRRHGLVEYLTAQNYIHKYLKAGSRILDVGAGTGRYAIALKEEGYDVTAVELTRPNIAIMKQKDPNLRVVEADGRSMPMLMDKQYDLIILFGPLYHLQGQQDKIAALNEAIRVLKDDGVILISYIMNEYAVIYHGFIENKFKECQDLFEDDYKIKEGGNDLYSYMRLEEIDELNEICHLERLEIIAADGPADYLRPILNRMDEETFKGFIDYHLKTCRRPELLGASSHVIDIVKKS